MRVGLHVSSHAAAAQGTPVLTSDKTGERTAQPASYCGVVLSPPTAAGGFAFLQRTGADEVAYNVSLAGWGAGNTLRSVQIQPGDTLTRNPLQVGVRARTRGLAGALCETVLSQASPSAAASWPVAGRLEAVRQAWACMRTDG